MGGIAAVPATPLILYSVPEIVFATSTCNRAGAAPVLVKWSGSGCGCG